MADLRRSNSPLGVNVFAFTQSYLDGAKQVDGGIALAMENFDPTIKHEHYGKLKQLLLER
jgi:hypothetical protein